MSKTLKEATIQELEAEARKKKGEAPKPYSVEEMKELPDADLDPARLRATLFNAPLDEGKISHASSRSRLEAGYAAQPDGSAVRKARRNDLEGGTDE